MSLQDSTQIENVKVLLKVGADGRGIAEIVKVGTSGIVDTYDIVLSDGTRIPFDVTNGSSIDSIEKTATVGLVDTYTITLTNGDTFEFEVTNADGSTAGTVGYDNTSSGLDATNVQDAIDEVAEITDEVNDNKANKTDLTNISQSGATATQAISSGTYFYLNGVLVRAKTAIASGATFTENTNYEVVTAGGLNDLVQYAEVDFTIPSSGNTKTLTFPDGFTTSNSFPVACAILADAWYWNQTQYYYVYYAGTAPIFYFTDPNRGRSAKVIFCKPTTL